MPYSSSVRARIRTAVRTYRIPGMHGCGTTKLVPLTAQRSAGGRRRRAAARRVHGRVRAWLPACLLAMAAARSASRRPGMRDGSMSRASNRKRSAAEAALLLLPLPLLLLGAASPSPTHARDGASMSCPERIVVGVIGAGQNTKVTHIVIYHISFQAHLLEVTHSIYLEAFRGDPFPFGLVGDAHPEAPGYRRRRNRGGRQPQPRVNEGRCRAVWHSEAGQGRSAPTTPPPQPHPGSATSFLRITRWIGNRDPRALS
eukprot:SAG31_NODE_1884_length_6996_cov_4.386835_5_plen_257_part_00